MIREKVQNDVKEALRAKEELKVSTLRLLIGAIQNYEIAKEGTSYKADDEEIKELIGKEVKKRKESIEQFKAGGRTELVEKETKEMAILQAYLPEQMGEDEIKKIVDEKIKEVGASSIDEIGKVMGVLSAQLKGKADMGMASKLVREALS